MPRTLILALSALGLSACLRFGYIEHPPAADGGMKAPPDAATRFDASTTSDSSTTFDANVYGDGATRLDGAAARDAGSRDAGSMGDAAASVDATTSNSDAAAAQDASTTADASTNNDASTAVDSGTPCTPSPISDYCTSLPALPAVQNIDGVLDCGPQLIDITPVSWTSTNEPLPTDNHARYAAAWRPEGLYVYVEVDDPALLPALSGQNPWCGDGVELYADSDGVYASANYDLPGAMQLVSTAPPSTAGTTLAEDALYHTDMSSRVDKWSANHIAVQRANGYALEAFITAAELKLTTPWMLTAGGKVGFDIAINVSVSSASSSQKVDCGYGMGQYYLRVSQTPCNRNSCRPHANASAFCTATLQ
jgi:hypothetical protein